jgi:hypothetical protein
VETTANQITLDLVLEKRRLGKSTIAQNVGITGTIAITISISKFNGLKSIYQPPAIRASMPAQAVFSLTVGCRSQTSLFSENL